MLNHRDIGSAAMIMQQNWPVIRAFENIAHSSEGTLYALVSQTPSISDKLYTTSDETELGVYRYKSIQASNRGLVVRIT